MSLLVSILQYAICPMQYYVLYPLLSTILQHMVFVEWLLHRFLLRVEMQDVKVSVCLGIWTRRNFETSGLPVVV